MEEALTRFWEQVGGRTSGPFAMRFILQPTVAAVLAIRAGLRDAKANRPPFLWTILSDPEARKEMIRSGWKDVGKVFVLACVLDGAYQVIVHRELRPLPMLVMAVLLAIVPYVVIRGPVSRMAKAAAARRTGR